MRLRISSRAQEASGFKELIMIGLTLIIGGMVFYFAWSKINGSP